ncbi:tetratricopeptide repeat protein [Croceicoccus estronivorus]|uniref:tetratricopeptide repeat protein n=1 Tax=Croceicoccus estronivorus TaxID=1172626 RepID=UPI001F3E3DFE|nr:hypothetical protein [Croceicoccus estronivorus]
MLAISACAAVGTAVPAAAQVDDARMRKVEAEVRALQRKVFPGGDGRFFNDGTTAGTSQTDTGLPPATSALTDVLARLDAMETRIANLTAQVESNTNTLARLSGRVAALEPTPPATPATASGVGANTSSADANLSAMSGGASAASKPSVPAAPAAAKPAPPSAERLARVQAITKPDTGDAGEDEYTYGFRLWEAKLYPEAQQQLRLYVEKYPQHRLISYGRNLLGRAYLDDGKPKEAAPWFVKNYDEDMNGARAGDSLLFLAEAMTAINDTSRACIALAKFGEVYPALATGRLQGQYDADRAKVKCK